MSIIKNYQEGKTELNKLKFKSTMGSGHPGNPPLIQKRVPTESKDASPIRGTQIAARLDDVGRIGQLFARAEGLRFLSNNTALNLTIGQSYLSENLNLQERLKVLGSNLAFSAQDTIRTLGSTLASIPVAGTGAHFIKGASGLYKYSNQSFVSSRNPAFPSPLETKQTRIPEFSTEYQSYDKITGIPSNDNTRTTISIGQPGMSKVRHDKEGNFYERESDSFAKDTVNSRGSFTDGSVQEDYVKFVFEILPIDTENSTFLQFRSFIDSFDDSYTGNWNEVNYIGRGEPMYNYSGFRRSINVSFKSAIATRSELLPMYEKLNLLASTTAPSYSNSNLMRGTVVRMTIGDYIASTPGIITSVSYSWNTQYPWEIKEDDDKTKARVLPHVLDCTLSFTPIHSFTPSTLSTKYVASKQ